MIYWSIVFLIVALISAFFGFTGLAIASAGIAKILFYIFGALFVLALILRALRGR